MYVVCVVGMLWVVCCALCCVCVVLHDVYCVVLFVGCMQFVTCCASIMVHILLCFICCKLWCVVCCISHALYAMFYM